MSKFDSQHTHTILIASALFEEMHTLYEYCELHFERLGAVNSYLSQCNVDKIRVGATFPNTSSKVLKELKQEQGFWRVQDTEQPRSTDSQASGLVVYSLSQEKQLILCVMGCGVFNVHRSLNFIFSHIDIDTLCVVGSCLGLVGLQQYDILDVDKHICYFEHSSRYFEHSSEQLDEALKGTDALLISGDIFIDIAARRRMGFEDEDILPITLQSFVRVAKKHGLRAAYDMESYYAYAYRNNYAKMNNCTIDFLCLRIVLDSLADKKHIHYYRDVRVVSDLIKERILHTYKL